MNRRRSQAEEQATQLFFQTLSPALVKTCSASDSVLSSSSCHPSLLQLERDANSDARVMRTDHRSQFCVSPLPSKPEPWRPYGRPPSHARSRPSPYPRQCIESCCTTQNAHLPLIRPPPITKLCGESRPRLSATTAGDLGSLRVSVVMMEAR